MATPAELEQRIADLEKKIAELKAEETPSMLGLLDAVFPSEARQHMRKARKEQLLAFRSLLDKWIDRIDEEKPAPRREAIRVE